MAADRGIAADLETGPAEFVLNLLVTLFDPGAQAVKTHDLGQAGGRENGKCG